MNELDLFAAAIAIADPIERAGMLGRECAGRSELRQRIDQLLDAHFQSHPVLDRTVLDQPGIHVPNAQPGAVIAGRYRLLEEIGEGGMGTVWAAEQLQPVRRKVALKLIKAGMDSKSVIARFEAERQALAMMDHPNVAKVLDGGLTEAGRPFFVMEYIKGVPITEYCDAKRLSVPERLQLFTQLCQAVQHAHQKGIIHRDLKPSNILVAPYDDQPVPKIIDFGLAKAMHQSLTEKTLHTVHGSAVGTPLYMSPEQAQLNNLDVDTRADIYSLGVLLYELLTGTTPLEKKRFREVAWDEVRRIIREEEPLRPSARLSSTDTLASLAVCRQTEPLKLTKQVRGELDWIVMKALEKDRTRRYETANGFAADVLRHLSGEAVQAHPPGTAYRLKKFVRRNKSPVLVAGLVGVVLLAGIVGTTIGLIEARRQEGLALTAASEERQAKVRESQRAVGEQQARADADARRQDAERNLAYARKGNEILGSVFAGLDPNKNYATVGEFSDALKANLDKAVQELEGSAIGDPLEVAAMQSTLGESLLALGDPSQAIILFAKARATRTAKLGADHPDTLTSMANLARGYRIAGKLDLALPLTKETLELTRARLGADHPDTLTAMNNLALGYQSTGNLDLALPLYEETLRCTKARLGTDHPDTLRSMNNLASCFRAAGKLDLALPLLEETVKLTKANLGADHPHTLMSMNNLALGYQSAGNLDLALPLLEETVKLTKAKLGADHPQTLMSMNNLASCYSQLKKLNQSAALFEEVLKLREKKLGRQHPETQTTVANLGVNYKNADRLKQAIPLLEEAYEFSRKHPPLSWVGKQLFDAYTWDGATAKATELIREELADARQTLPPDSPQLAGLLMELGRILLQQQEWTNAESVFRDCLSIRETKQPAAWSTFNTMSILGGALLGQKKYADAEPLLLKGYEGMKQRDRSIPSKYATQILEALDRLIELSTATNQPNEEKKWQAERAKYPAPVEKSPPPRNQE